MNVEITNAISPYLDMLYDINEKLIRLSDLNVYYNDMDSIEQITVQISKDLSQLIPYGYDKKRKKYVLKQNNGLLCFNESLTYLQKNSQKAHSFRCGMNGKTCLKN